MNIGGNVVAKKKNEKTLKLFCLFLNYIRKRNYLFNQAKEKLSHITRK